MASKGYTLIKTLPVLGNAVRKFNTWRTRVPAGHFYSPIVSVKEVKKRESKIYCTPGRDLPGINLNEQEQVDLLSYCCENYYSEIPFSEEYTGDTRYYYNNKYFGHADATSLYCMIRYFRPRKIIEVGSGYSSAVMLDVNERYFDNTINLHFIEPYPNRLNRLLRVTDRKSVSITVSDLQDVDCDFFSGLEENDLLFIDSTHVSKTGSDVNYLLFEILPRIRKGVVIHLHDIFYPFEYPKDWVIYGNGRFGWNEIYILRAFLTHQDTYQIILFNDFLQHFHKDGLLTTMPNYTNYGRGGSIYLRKCH